MKRVLVTGAGGFVGANLARRLLRDGHEVHLFLRPGGRRWRIDELGDAARVHEVDLADETAVRASVEAARPDWVFHLAAHGAYASQRDVRRMVAANVTGTVNLVEAAARRGFESFVHAGTSSEYGFKDHAPHEREWIEPNSDYAVTKACATLFCRQAAQRLGLRLVTLRLYSVYGPYEEPTRFVPTLLVRGLRGELPPLVRPESAHDYVYVDDVSEAFLLAASGPRTEPGSVYNVGTGTERPAREIVEIARRVLGVGAAPQWGSMPDRPWDTAHWVCDNRRIRQELGWRPVVSFEDGFRRTLDWLCSSPERRARYEASLASPG